MEPVPRWLPGRPRPLKKPRPSFCVSRPPRCAFQIANIKRFNIASPFLIAGRPRWGHFFFFGPFLRLWIYNRLLFSLGFSGTRRASVCHYLLQHLIVLSRLSLSPLASHCSFASSFQILSPKTCLVLVNFSHLVEPSARTCPSSVAHPSPTLSSLLVCCLSFGALSVFMLFRP